MVSSADYFNDHDSLIETDVHQPVVAVDRRVPVLATPTAVAAGLAALNAMACFERAVSQCRSTWRNHHYEDASL